MLDRGRISAGVIKTATSPEIIHPDHACKGSFLCTSPARRMPPKDAAFAMVFNNNFSTCFFKLRAAPCEFVVDKSETI